MTARLHQTKPDAAENECLHIVGGLRSIPFVAGGAGTGGAEQGVKKTTMTKKTKIQRLNAERNTQLIKAPYGCIIYS